MKNKIDCGKYPLIYPLPIAVIAANVEGKPNCAPIGNCGIVSVDPAVVYISINKHAYTTKGILKDQMFSINFASCDNIQEVDYCGLVSGRDVDKSEYFNYFYGNGSQIPMIEQFGVNLLCQVRSKIEIHDMVMFVADVVKTYVREECCTNGYADTKKVNPIMYTMDNQYWSLGEHIGTGFDAGKELLK